MLSLVVTFCSLLTLSVWPTATRAEDDIFTATRAEDGEYQGSKAQDLDDNKVNIVWLWFDDLAIGDVSFMGGDIPTPILDSLASRDAIKLNFHYTESLCTASRSALMTGRYAWKSGINELAAFNSDLGFDTSLKLYPEILDDNAMNYNNFIAGKWHIGYSSQSRLPFNRGFGHGLYTHWGPQYYDRFYQVMMKVADENFGQPDYSIKHARDNIFGDELHIHDTFKIHTFRGVREESAVYVNDRESYCEDLFTDAVLEFIGEQDNEEHPFHIYYSLYTPHRTNVDPPSVKPDGTAVAYGACEKVFGGADSCAASDRCLYCKQIHYASVRIQEIIHALQENDKIDWDNTVIVITSDNGPAEGYGSAMPFRGKKTAPYEGGIRTPGFMLGGLVENIVQSNHALDNGLCQYNEMVHISDWYHIFMKMNGVVASTDFHGYDPDSDHADLDVWEHMKCYCGANGRAEREFCDTLYTKRTELVSFRMCDDPDVSGDEPYVYGAALIQDGYKLIVGGSNGALQECPIISNHGDTNTMYIGMDETRSIPNADYYELWYSMAKESAAGGMGDTLYDSQCLNELYAHHQSDDNHNINEEDYEPFVFHDMLLYDLATDKVEACAIDDEERMTRMHQYLMERSLEYNSPRKETFRSLASYKAQLESYDCSAVYTVPWEEEIDSLDVNELWQNLIDYYNENCRHSQPERYFYFRFHAMSLI